MRHTYRYTECGLDNVMIEGFKPITDDAGEEVFHIPNVRSLHKVIAHAIITHRHAMHPKELRFLRTEMGLTQAELANILKVARATIVRWESGDHGIDSAIEALIRILAAERLRIDQGLSVEEITGRCVWSARLEPIHIDGSDPEDYRPLAA